MTAPRDFLVIPGTPVLPAGGAEPGAQIERAADMVADFTGQNTLPALETLIEAAEQPLDRAAAETVRRKANKITRQTATLYEEVAHFLTQGAGEAF